MIQEYKKAISRERVFGVSLIDFFVQLIFVFIALLAIGYIDDLDKEKYKKFIEEGKTIYGENFQSTWEQFISNPKNVKIVVEGQKLVGEVEKFKNLVGYYPCLFYIEKKGVSVKFKLSKENSLVFNGFTNEFMDYANSKDSQFKTNVKKIKVGTVVNTKDKLKSLFKFIELDSNENNCRHRFSVDNNFKQSIYTNDEIKRRDRLMLLPTTIFVW